MPLKSVCCCFLLLLLLSARAAFPLEVENTPMREALALPGHEQVLRFLPGYLELLGQEEYRGEVFSAMESATNSVTLERCIIALGVRGIYEPNLPRIMNEIKQTSPLSLPVYDWNDENWFEKSKAMIRSDLTVTGLENRRGYYLWLQVLPVFFSEVELGQWFDPQVLSSLASSTCWCRNCTDLTIRIRRRRHAMRIWSRALWEWGDEQRQAELIELFFVKPMSREYPSSLSYGDLIPIYDWFESHPDALRGYLAHENRSVRQEALRIAMFESDPLVDWNDPLIISNLIEALPRGWRSVDPVECQQKLMEHSAASLPAIRKTFSETEDGLQKGMLCDLLIGLKDDETRQDLIEYLYGLLEAEEYHPGAFLWRERRYYTRRCVWVAQRLVMLGEPAAQYLATQIGQSRDQQQVAMSIMILREMGRENLIVWNEELVRVLLKGLEDNDVGYDLGMCASALKSAPPEYINQLLDRVVEKNDEQLRLAVSILMQHLNRDEDYYKLLYKDGFESYGEDRHRRYWEYNFPGAISEILPSNGLLDRLNSNHLSE